MYAPLIEVNPNAQIPDTFVPEIILIQNGWSPQYRLVARPFNDEENDQVLQLFNWTGGFGNKPLTGYLGATGIVQNISQAINVKGFSAYRIWLLAGNTGTEDDFLASLSPSPVSTSTPNSSLVKRVGDALYNFIDQYTHETVTFTKSTDTVADGIIIIQRGDEFFKRNFSGAMNVKWFGAKGDGITDDTVAIQKALNYSSPTFIPKGQYNVGVLNINIARKKIYGESYQTTTLYATIPGQEYVLGTKASSDYFVYEEIDISDLKIDGAYKAKDGLKLNIIFSSIAKIVTTSCVRFGIYHAMGYTSKYTDIRTTYSGRAGMAVYQEGNLLQFDRCTFSNNPNGSGMEFISGSTPVFQSCSFENNGKNGVLFTWQTDPSITFPPYVDTQVECVSMIGCYFENNGQLDKSLYGNIDFKGQLDGARKVRNVRIIGAHFGLTGDEIAINFDFGFENVTVSDSGFYYVSGPVTKAPISLSDYYLDTLRRFNSKINLYSGNNLTEDSIQAGSSTGDRSKNIRMEVIGKTQYIKLVDNGLTFEIYKNNKTVELTIRGAATATVNKDLNFDAYGLYLYTNMRYVLRSLENGDSYSLVTRGATEFNGLNISINASTVLNERLTFFTE